jgi:hypothetical protein
MNYLEDKLMSIQIINLDEIPSEPSSIDTIYIDKIVMYEGFETKDELDLHKVIMIIKLGTMISHGIALSQNYNLNSSYKIMKAEYLSHMHLFCDNILNN